MQKEYKKPIEISQIDPVRDDKGCIKEWGIRVTFDGQNVEPPHAPGARFVTKNTEKNTLAEYRFSESVMQIGLQRALLFRDAMLKQIARQNEER